MTTRLPFNADAERSVLAAVLLGGRDVALQLRDQLTGEDFHVPKHQAVWDAMVSVADGGDPVDAVTIEDRLRRMGTAGIVGGMQQIAGLADSYATAHHAREHAKIVHDESVRRKVMAACRETIEGVLEADDPVVYAGQAQMNLAKAAEGRYVDGVKHARESCRASFASVTDFAKSGGVVGRPSGLSCVDAFLGGLVPKRYYIVAGRPSMGKTALATGFAVHNAVWTVAEMLTPADRRRRLVPALVFSMEMDTVSLLDRIAKSMAGIDSREVARRGHLTEPEVKALVQAYERLHQGQLYIDETRRQAIGSIQAKAMRWRADLARGGYPQTDPVLVVVDYIQLGRGVADQRRDKTWEREVSEISGGLQGLAGDLNAAVIALSQLNRAVEKRDDKRPTLADLRDSGSLEQDANAVIFPFRPEHYVNDDDHAAMDKVRGKAEIIIGKNRDGPTGTGAAEFIGKYTRFQNPTQPEQTSVPF